MISRFNSIVCRPSGFPFLLSAASFVMSLATFNDCVDANNPLPAERSLNASIDSILTAEYTARAITPALMCSDELFLRRITLDLVGRIPTLDEVKSFEASPDRSSKIRSLLESNDFSISWSEIWTANWIGYSEDINADRELLRAWVEGELRSHRPYDELVRNLISATGWSTLEGNTIFMLRNQEEPTIKVSRLFLGIRLDCARCHDHPFDRWTKEHYEQFSKFFQWMRTNPISDGVVELSDEVIPARQVARSERPRFLTDAKPQTGLWRKELGMFVSNSRPFARAYVNRVWYQLMGRGIFDPPDDLSHENKPCSPELLEFLADQARAQKFDIRELVSLICNSEAYQREVAIEGRTAEEIQLFAVRSIKPMTIEQSIDSYFIAIGDLKKPIERRDWIRSLADARVDDDSSATWTYTETVQSLMQRLTSQVRAPSKSTDELFRITLTRKPTAVELTQCEKESSDDVMYALLNSNEFYFNH